MSKNRKACLLSQSKVLLAKKFLDHNKNNIFQQTGKFTHGKVFKGDGGRKVKKKWVFTTKSTLYTIDPIGWFFSRKFDGFRSYSVCNKLMSRSGLPFNAPVWFIEALPLKTPVDGELVWINHGREDFAKTASVLRKKNATDCEWENISFYLFDAPDPTLTDKPLHTRLQVLAYVVKECNKRWPAIKRKYNLKRTTCPLVMIDQRVVTTFAQVYSAYKTVLARGGEGLVLRCPDSKYSFNRSAKYLKWKPELSDECVVVGFNSGTGKFKGVLGTFSVELAKNKDIKFKLSGHLSNEFRKHYIFKNSVLVSKLKPDGIHPVVGNMVTFSYLELHPSGVPRSPIYQHIRNKGE